MTDVHDETIREHRLKTWTDAVRILAVRRVQVARKNVEVQVDWKPAHRRWKRYFAVSAEVQRFLREKKSTPTGDLPYRYPRDKVIVPIHVKNLDEDKNVTGLHHIVSSVLYDKFLILNLSDPGSLDLYRSKIAISDKREAAQHGAIDINLGDVHFDLSCIDGIEGRWPAPKVLDLEEVSRWFLRFRTGAAQLPKNRIERVFFALFHLSSTDFAATSIVWLFYALETLFDTRPGENRKTLERRICLLLEPGAAEERFLVSSLRKLYEVRSSIVHGGLELIHPMHNDILDPSVNDSFAKLLKSFEFGFSVLLVSVQTMIDKSWIDMEFSETVRGVVE